MGGAHPAAALTQGCKIRMYVGFPTSSAQSRSGHWVLDPAGTPQETQNRDGAIWAGDGGGAGARVPRPVRVSPAGCRTWRCTALAARGVWQRQRVIHVQPFPSLETFLACGSSQPSLWLTLG